jgi:hypothetical protein
MTRTAEPLSPAQIETIVDKVVPLIAAPEDHEFFKGVLFVNLENCNSAEAGRFISALLRKAAS